MAFVKTIPAAEGEVERRIARTQPKFYEQAISTLLDLRDLAMADRQEPAFGERLARLRHRHASKPALLKRIQIAGLQVP